ncbi:MAG: NAD-dependent DNA ligase LigA [Lachnospiraceae bacterium]|nr:NAD-dependent DNA ligase LigA [Lachnospiraceae bacterium]
MEKETYLRLVEQIRYHMRQYYDLDAAEISDYEYDQLMLRLKEAERLHPDWVTPDSPTQVVGGRAGFAEDAAAGAGDSADAAGASAGKRKAGVLVTHDVPMLSIEDVFSKEDVISWVHEVRAVHPDARFVVDEKIDGLSMSLRYEHGELVLAETRGDGFTGEDVTPNARVIDDVVQHLGAKDAYLEVRGEVYMTHEAFARTNELQEARGKKTFANPRNCAAGTLRQLDASMVRERGLSFFVFNIQRASDETLTESHSEGLKRLADTEGMRVAPSFVCVTDDEILAAIDAIGIRRGALPYDIDGAVVKLDRIALRDDFPAGSKYSAGHIAYKYPPEEKEAEITEIELTVGMTGRVNPTAVFTPVRLCGTSVSRATLHNQDFIDKLGIGIGKRVLVYKSGEIIPKIRGTVTDEGLRTEETGAADIALHGADMAAYRASRGIFAIPDTCPVCGARITRGRTGAEDNADAADLYCTNPDCEAKLVRRVIHFVSRDAMDIKGFGAEYISKLIGAGYIRNIDDIYTLKQHRDELVEQGLIGKEKNTDKLLQMIEQSGQNEPWRLLSGLAIANVGRTSARTLMRRFASMDALAAASVEELTRVDDIGEITARGIRAWFDDPAHAAMLARLKDAGVNMGETGGKTGTSLAGRTYVVTGDLKHFKNRDELIDFIEARGGKVAGSVSKKTYALINNDAASVSGKNKKAQALGIPILTEEAFLREAEGNEG